MSTPPNKFIYKIFSILLTLSLLFASVFQASAYGSGAGDDITVLYHRLPLSVKQYAFLKCSEKNISYSLFCAVAYNESRFTSGAIHINKNGTVDRGLCQINDACHPFLIRQGLMTDPDSLFNPYTNIDCFIGLMEYHLSYTTDEYHALLAYQVGEGAFKNKYSFGSKTNTTHQSVWDKKEIMDSYFHSNTQALCQLLTPGTYPFLSKTYPQLKNPTVLFAYITKFPAGCSWKHVKEAYLTLM